MTDQDTTHQDPQIVIMPKYERDITTVHRYLAGNGYTIQLVEAVDTTQSIPVLEQADICLVDVDVWADEQPAYRWLTENISGDLIGMCDRPHYEQAAQAVEEGWLYDYVIIKPLYDIHQVGFAVQRALKQQESDRAIQVLLQELEQFRHEILVEQIDSTHTRLREKLNGHLDDLRQGLLSQQRETISVKNQAHFDALFQEYRQQVPTSLQDAKDKLHGELFMSLESTQEAFETQMEGNSQRDTHTVLLVDDQDSVLRNVSRILQVHGYVVLTADTGEQGVLMAREQTPTVILMDIDMPGLTGIEAARMLKKDEATAVIPIIMMTSYATEEFVDKARQAGANGYIAKPFSASLLFDRIQQAIQSDSTF